MVEKAEAVEADDETVVGDGTRGRSWEGWEAGCGKGTYGGLLLLAGIGNPQVVDTSEQSKVGKLNQTRGISKIPHLLKCLLVAWKA